MIGVLSTVPGTLILRRLSRARVAVPMPVLAFVALGRVGVSPNMGQSVSRLGRAVPAASGVVAVAAVVSAATVVGVGSAGGWPSAAPHALRGRASAQAAAKVMTRAG